MIEKTTFVSQFLFNAALQPNMDSLFQGQKKPIQISWDESFLNLIQKQIQ